MKSPALTRSWLCDRALPPEAHGGEQDDAGADALPTVQHERRGLRLQRRRRLERRHGLRR